MSVRARDIYCPSEDEEQETFVKYCNLRKILVVHIANEGKRSVAYAAKLKRIGLRRGFPDLFFPIPRGSYHGMFIELKTMKGRLTPDQRWWLAELNARGYHAIMCRGADEAIREIDKYMNLREDEQDATEEGRQ